MKARTYTCPLCGGEVTTKDVNIQKDIMLCPKCGEVSSFSEVIGRIEKANREDDGRRLLNAPPPKHLKLEFDPTDVTGRIVCTFRKASASAFAIVPFTLVWSGFSMGAIYGSQIMKHEFDWVASLFGIPFLIGSIFLVSVCLFSLGVGKRVLTLERGKGRYFFGVGPIGIWRNFTYDRKTRVEGGCTSYSVGGGRYGGGRALSELHLTRPGSSDTIHICAGMSDDALDYIEALLKREAAKV